MYESLMDGAIIQVRAFGDRHEAAKWLGVPVEVLLPGDDTSPLEARLDPPLPGR
jgi:hypothetical protein